MTTLHQLVLFSGYHVPEKRYKAFLPGIVIDPNQLGEEQSILTHSCGIIKALLFCQIHSFTPKMIVAMDPPDVSKAAILARLPELPHDLQVLYQKFLELTPAKPCAIYCYRREENDAKEDDIFDTTTRYRGLSLSFRMRHPA
jgi:hypothetical protein